MATERDLNITSITYRMHMFRITDVGLLRGQVCLFVDLLNARFERMWLIVVLKSLFVSRGSRKRMHTFLKNDPD